MSRTVVVTGLSGAGRASCLRILEDLGFEAVDNLPFQLLAMLLKPGQVPERPLAVGIDSRTRGIEPLSLVAQIDACRAAGAAPVTLVFFECDDEILQRRFTETRRRHPMAGDRTIADGIALERDFLAPIEKAADIVFDTTTTSVADLRRWIISSFGDTTDTQDLTVTIVSFGFRNGLPREADMVFDARFLRNPHYVDALRPLTGQHPEVQAYVRSDPDFDAYFQNLVNLVVPLLPRYKSEGKSYLTIAIGCTGGKHRSVFTAERLAERLKEAKWPPTVIHRDMPRASAAISGSMA